MKKFLLIAAAIAPFLANVALADDTAPAGGDKPAKKSSSKKGKSKKADKTAAPAAGDDKAAAPANP